MIINVFFKRVNRNKDTSLVINLALEAQKIIDTGRQQIAGISFSPELMQYVEMLVEECNDEEPTSLYEDAKETLATDLSASI